MTDQYKEIPADQSKVEGFKDGMCMTCANKGNNVALLQTRINGRIKLICPECNTKTKSTSTLTIMGNVGDKEFTGKKINTPGEPGVALVDTGKTAEFSGPSKTIASQKMSLNSEDGLNPSSISFEGNTLLLMLAKECNLKNICELFSDELLINLKVYFESLPPPKDMKTTRNLVKFLDILDQVMEESGIEIKENKINE